MSPSQRAPNTGALLPGLRALRQQRGLSQAELARRAGLTPVFVNRVEHQRQKALSLIHI